MSDASAVVRPLQSDADYQACLDLQYETWGRGFRESVPPSMMRVAQMLGGVASGAFRQDGRMLGFVFGITGVRNGALVHWSDLLAVRPEARNTGIGRQLKAHQRSSVAAVGARAVLWTFDPLVGRNAHINFNVFGASATEYVVDMYGTNTGSDLHRGIGTDRLVMEWPVDDDEVQRRRSLDAAALGRGTPLRIDVPEDISSLLGADPGAARRWREETRRAFTTALSDGYRVRGFRRGPAGTGGHYLLAR